MNAAPASESFAGAFSGAASGPNPDQPTRVWSRLFRAVPLFRTVPLHRIDWAPDLAEDIGSRRWLRGLATLGGLIVTAFALWPDFALHAAPTGQGDDAVRSEFAAQTIQPLASPPSTTRQRLASAAVATLASAPERTQIQLTAFVVAGDSFQRLLERAGVASSDAASAAAAVSAKVALGDIAPGTRVDLVLGPRPAADAPRGLESLELRAKFDTALALSRSAGGFAATTRAIAVEEAPLRIRGIVGPSLYRSARAAGASPDAIQQYLAALDSTISLEGDVQPGDAFDIIMTAKHAATGEVRVGQVLYAGLDRGETPVAELMRWGSGNAFQTADGLTHPVYSTQSVGMGLPVAGHITSSFGLRFHPILGYTRMHAGVDIGAAWGSPIHATADGVVSFSGRHGGHGNYVRIEHGGGLATGYGHMSTILAWNGERVKAGQVIGYVGSTGLSTGPHLHYEMYENGRTVNPLGGRMATSTTVINQVDPKQVAAFKAKLEALKKIRPGSANGAMALGLGGGGRVALR